jgi:hypothetical protein
MSCGREYTGVGLVLAMLPILVTHMVLGLPPLVFYTLADAQDIAVCNTVPYAGLFLAIGLVLLAPAVVALVATGIVCVNTLAGALRCNTQSTYLNMVAVRTAHHVYVMTMFFAVVLGLIGSVNTWDESRRTLACTGTHLFRWSYGYYIAFWVLIGGGVWSLRLIYVQAHRHVQAQRHAHRGDTLLQTGTEQTNRV